MKNRIFRRPQSQRNIKSAFVDVSDIAYGAGFPFTTLVQRELVQNYTLSGIADDDEGRLFVVSVFDDVIAAILGKLQAWSVSHGNTFTITFDFPAQHRRQSMPEVLTLAACFGAWDEGSRVHISIAARAEHGGEGTADQSRFTPF